MWYFIVSFFRETPYLLQNFPDASRHGELLLLRFRRRIVCASWDRACFCTQYGPACGVLRFRGGIVATAEIGRAFCTQYGPACGVLRWIASRGRWSIRSKRHSCSCLCRRKCREVPSWGFGRAKHRLTKTAKGFICGCLTLSDRGYSSYVLWQRTPFIIIYWVL